MGRGAVVRIQRLGDAEVEQFHLPVGGDEHVARLQVSVHEQHAVRVGHRIGELEEHLQLLRQGQARTGIVNGPAVDEFHHEVGQAVWREAGVEQPRDVGVVQRGQRLLLLSEALQHAHAVHAALEDLDGCAAHIRAVRTVGAVDLAHAPTAEQAVELP